MRSDTDNTVLKPMAVHAETNLQSEDHGASASFEHSVCDSMYCPDTSTSYLGVLVVVHKAVDAGVDLLSHQEHKQLSRCGLLFITSGLQPYQTSTNQVLLGLGHSVTRHTYGRSPNSSTHGGQVCSDFSNAPTLPA